MVNAESEGQNKNTLLFNWQNSKNSKACGAQLARAIATGFGSYY
jgi:hypothetical protein